MAIKSGRLYMEVGALTEETEDVTPPTGHVWQLRHFCGSAAYLDDTVVCLIWDADGTPVILDCTHGDKDVTLDVSITGDGTKKLRISLQNDTNTARVMGCHWEGRDDQ